MKPYELEVERIALPVCDFSVYSFKKLPVSYRFKRAISRLRIIQKINDQEKIEDVQKWRMCFMPKPFVGLCFNE